MGKLRSREALILMTALTLSLSLVGCAAPVQSQEPLHSLVTSTPEARLPKTEMSFSYLSPEGLASKLPEENVIAGLQVNEQQGNEVIVMKLVATTGKANNQPHVFAVDYSKEGDHLQLNQTMQDKDGKRYLVLDGNFSDGRKVIIANGFTPSAKYDFMRSWTGTLLADPQSLNRQIVKEPVSREISGLSPQQKQNLYESLLKAGFKKTDFFPAMIASSMSQLIDFTPAAALPTRNPDEIKSFMLPISKIEQKHALSCELAASQMVIDGIRMSFSDTQKEKIDEIMHEANVPNWEEYLIQKIPKDANPHVGFRGDIDGGGYGVYAEPLAKAFETLGFKAWIEYVSGATGTYPTVKEFDQTREIRDLKNHVLNGEYVIVWMSHTNRPAVRTETSKDETYNLIQGEHAVVVIGYDVEGLLILDPLYDPYARSSASSGKTGLYTTWKEIPNWDKFNGMRLVLSGR